VYLNSFVLRNVVIKKGPFLDPRARVDNQQNTKVNGGIQEEIEEKTKDIKLK
jgi:hypothetical protein